MRHKLSCIAALLLLIPEVTAAQAERGTVPVIGLALGFTQLPEPLVNTCGGNSRTFPTAEFKAAAAGSRWSVETRAAAFTSPVVYSCLFSEIAHESGTHTDRLYPYDRSHGDVSLSAHLWHAPAAGFLSLGIGAGYLLNAQLPYFSSGAALRIRDGRLAFVMEAQSNWSRLRSDLVTAEWQQFQQTRIVETSPDHAWHGTFALRLGFEWGLR